MQGHRGSIGFWSGGRSGSEGKSQAVSFTGVSVGKARQGMVNSLGLANLNDISGLIIYWHIGLTLSTFILTFVRIDPVQSLFYCKLTETLNTFCGYVTTYESVSIIHMSVGRVSVTVFCPGVVAIMVGQAKWQSLALPLPAQIRNQEQ